MHTMSAFDETSRVETLALGVGGQFEHGFHSNGVFSSGEDHIVDRCSGCSQSLQGDL